MGTTCASFHALWRGSVDDAAKAISRAYTKLGYERVKKPPAEGGKQVILLARASERYVSVFDSTNADLDSGELKDAALAASKLLKTGAVVTSLYDSDSYEFVVFSNGRQVDLLMTDADSYNGPLKRLAGKSRVTQWNRIFGSVATVEQVERTAAPGTMHWRPGWRNESPTRPGWWCWRATWSFSARRSSRDSQAPSSMSIPRCCRPSRGSKPSSRRWPTGSRCSG